MSDNDVKQYLDDILSKYDKGDIPDWDEVGELLGDEYCNYNYLEIMFEICDKYDLYIIFDYIGESNRTCRSDDVIIGFVYMKERDIRRLRLNNHYSYYGLVDYYLHICRFTVEYARHIGHNYADENLIGHEDDQSKEDNMDDNIIDILFANDDMRSALNKIKQITNDDELLKMIINANIKPWNAYQIMQTLSSMGKSYILSDIKLQGGNV